MTIARRNRALICLATLLTALTISSSSASQMRAFWCDAWGSGFKTPGQTTQLVDFAEKHGFNAVFVEVRKRGDAYYDSSIEPRAADIPDGYDPLADILSKAHKRGIKVHAWLMMYDACAVRTEELDPSQICLRHPDWLSVDDTGENKYVGIRRYLDPGLPGVQDYLASVVVELARKYPVDGIYIDGLRYPDANWGYNPQSTVLFNDQYHRTGYPAPTDPDWCNWRREQVTKLAKRIPQEVHKVRPGVQVSVAAYWDQKRTYESFYQDWMGWAKAGYFDLTVPMVFVPKTVDDFRKMVDDELAVTGGKNMIIGQGAWRYPAEVTDEHLKVIREKCPQGFVIFDYAALSAAQADGKCLADKIRIVE